MSYNMPYTILREDLRELEVGYFINITTKLSQGKKMAVIVKKTPFRKPIALDCDAASTLTAQFIDADSNTSATSGTRTYKGFVGIPNQKILVQIKYIAFVSSTKVTLKWGKDEVPKGLDVTWSNENAPAGMIQTGNVGATPLFFQRFSLDNSQFMQMKIDNTSGSSTAHQYVILDCIEYEYEFENPVGTISYDEITPLGFLLHKPR